MLMDAPGVDGDLFNVGRPSGSRSTSCARVLAPPLDSEIVHIPYDESTAGNRGHAPPPPSIEKVNGAIGWSPTRS